MHVGRTHHQGRCTRQVRVDLRDWAGAQNYRVSVFPGRIRDGRFGLNEFLNAAFYGSAQGGYVIGKAPAGRDLAITNVRIVQSENSLLGVDFQPCEEAKTVAFTVPEGRVIYLGHLSYSYVEGGVRVTHRQDLESAKAYLQASYPNLAASLEQGSYDLLPVARRCGSTFMIPVYVPATK